MARAPSRPAGVDQQARAYELMRKAGQEMFKYEQDTTEWKMWRMVAATAEQLSHGKTHMEWLVNLVQIHNTANHAKMKEEVVKLLGDHSGN